MQIQVAYLKRIWYNSISCRNDLWKPHKIRLPEGKSRNEGSPPKGIATLKLLIPFVLLLMVEMKEARLRALIPAVQHEIQV